MASRFLQSLVELVSTQHMVAAAASKGEGEGEGEGGAAAEAEAATEVPSAALACSQFGEDALLPGGFESVIDPAMDEPIPPYPTAWQPISPGYEGGDGATQATTSREVEEGLVNR